MYFHWSKIKEVTLNQIYCIFIGQKIGPVGSVSPGSWASLREKTRDHFGRGFLSPLVPAEEKTSGGSERHVQPE